MIRPEDVQDKRVLISPLNWGMGHVSRCIGLIHQLVIQNNDVWIACDDRQKRVFEEYFSDVTFVPHAGYPFQFGGKGHFGWDLLKRSNALRKRLNEEREEVASIVKIHAIDVVISDHRYGFCSEGVPSIFLTHQLNLPVKWYEGGVNALHRKLIKRFTYVWLMDDDRSSLAGKLSADCPENGTYIGHYSRFALYLKKEMKSVEAVLVASGPESYAVQLIEQVLNDPSTPSGLHVVHATSQNFPNQCKGSWREKDALIRSAKLIISHSGYSTLMDCLELEAETRLTPTKGQAEQEYLLQLWKKRKG
ncbi:MAG: hypothetical protein CSA03_02845 [Bacteroidetes bacterium]|nr:MAG: hypothetical protein CSA03_02845 [Bacteroidota bacterium]